MATPPKDMDRVIICSLHMRNMIAGLGEDFRSLSAVHTIYQKCLLGERKYHRRHKKRYDELFEMFNRTRTTYSKFYSKQMIATDTALTELHYRNRIKFGAYFGLKQTPFAKLFKIFGEDDDLEIETINVTTHLIKMIDNEIESHAFREWIIRNNKVFCSEEKTNKTSEKGIIS